MRLLFLKITVIVFFILGFYKFCLSQTPSQIQRTQDMLEKEEVLRSNLQKKEKIFIKKIIVKGANLLTAEQIEEIISPFQKRWLAKEEIQQILEVFRQAYAQKGYSLEKIKISYQIVKRILEIKVEEVLK